MTIGAILAESDRSPCDALVQGSPIEVVLKDNMKGNPKYQTREVKTFEEKSLSTWTSVLINLLKEVPTHGPCPSLAFITIFAQSQRVPLQSPRLWSWRPTFWMMERRNSSYCHEVEKMDTLVESGAGHAVCLFLFFTDWAANQLLIQTPPLMLSYICKLADNIFRSTSFAFRCNCY